MRDTLFLKRPFDPQDRDHGPIGGWDGPEWDDEDDDSGMMDFEEEDDDDDTPFEVERNEA